MALESNRPVGRVHNGGDGIWDGAGWGALAGASAAGLAYGVTSPLTQNIMRHSKIAARNNYNDALNAGGMLPDSAQQKAIDRSAGTYEKRARMVQKTKQLNQAGFGSWKRATMVGGTSLMGGMLAGGFIDSVND